MPLPCVNKTTTYNAYMIILMLIVRTLSSLLRGRWRGRRSVRGRSGWVDEEGYLKVCEVNAMGDAVIGALPASVHP